MNIEHLSVSRANLFTQCQKAYLYKYHLKTKTDEPTPLYFSYGTIVHRIAELYVQNKKKISLKEIANQVLKGEVFLQEYGGNKTYAEPLSPEYKKKLPIHLEAVQNLVNKIGVDGEVEYNFKFDLDPPNHRLFTGVIDRLIKKKDSFWIIDYKTTKAGKWRKNEKSITNDLQLRSYCRVVQKEFNVDASNIKAALFYLDPPSKLIAVKFSNNTLLNTEKELLKTYKTIASADPKKVWGNVGSHCFMCEFKKICPHAKGGKLQENNLNKFGLL
jgi:ATP-dependent helicase/DNAse subunit B